VVNDKDTKLFEQNYFPYSWFPPYATNIDTEQRTVTISREGNTSSEGRYEGDRTTAVGRWPIGTLGTRIYKRAIRKTVADSRQEK